MSAGVSCEVCSSRVKHGESDYQYTNDGPPISGYVPFRIKEEPPIFSKQRMKLDLTHDILHMANSNNWLMCLMSHHVLLRLFLLQMGRYDDVSLEKYVTGLTVSKIFLGPTGNHLLTALVAPPGKPSNV